ncbi:D-amino acid aminotransferase [Castellaniella sp. GW247-6E4]|uniref:D-amino acid aminotransferase n=1 Tax=Castellaniella sp. GW247-6E4 TaxID=3140380 RepID=UPI0033152247
MIPDVDNDSIVYLNGEHVRLGDAQISVLDRGFIFGDGIYEVVPAYLGKPFRMEAHLARLLRSLGAIGLDTGWRRADWEHLILDMLAREGRGRDVMLYLQVTRGVAKRDHPFPQGARPTVFCMVTPFTRVGEVRETGLRTISLEDLRWHRCDIKSVSLLGNVLARQAAVEAGVDDVIQFRDGLLSEASAANVWVVRQGELLAPVRDHNILEGVRYGLLEELARARGIPFESRAISRDEVAGADELMLTSATKEVLPVLWHDGRPVGTGRPGPVYRALREAYDEAIATL